MLDVALNTDKNEQPKISHLQYDLLQKRSKVLSVNFSRDKNDKLDISSSDYRLVRTKSRVWPLDEPDKFYRISDQSRARFQNAEFLSDLALETEAAFYI